MSSPPWRKPYRRTGSSYWWARLPVASGSNRERSLGVRDRKQALQALTLLGASFNGPFRERAIVYAVARGEVSVTEFVEAYEGRNLEELAKRIESPDEDLNDHVEAWQEWLRTRRGITEGTRAKYRQQLREFMPEGRIFPASGFSRSAISSFLNGLKVGAPNRFRAALSSYARYLVEREVLQHNPVRDVQCAKERPPRMRSLTRAEAQKLIEGINSLEARAVHSLMCGSGMEIGTVLALRHRDVDVTGGTVHAHGTKRVHRDRVVRVTEPWCWEIFVGWLRSQRALPDAQVFRISYWAATEALQRALEAQKLTNYRSHDWRHTYGVQALRDGESPQVVAHQLGHKTAAMVHAVYGRYVPVNSDYRSKQTVGLTVASERAAAVGKTRAAG